MTGWDFVHTSARLERLASRLKPARPRPRTIEAVGMTKHQGRAIRGYSKGMRQRTKLAQALVHDPEVLFLDEPLTGTDPVARRDLMDIIQRLAQRRQKRAGLQPRAARSAIADAQHRACSTTAGSWREGHVRQIRDLIDKHPHHIVLVCDDYRQLAGRHVGLGRRRRRESARRAKSALMVETHSPDAFYSRLPAFSLEDGMAIKAVYSDDDNLESVFKYLVNR